MVSPTTGMALAKLVITVAPQKLICPHGGTYPNPMPTFEREKRQVPEASFTSFFAGLPIGPRDILEMLFPLITRRSTSTPSKSDHLFVCILLDRHGDMEESNILIGIQVDEHEAVSWDSGRVGNSVLQACARPIPCLKRVKLEQKHLCSSGGGHEEELCCAICLEELPVGCEAAQTSCSHFYHCSRIVESLAERNFCPLCRSCLPVG